LNSATQRAQPSGALDVTLAIRFAHKPLLEVRASLTSAVETSAAGVKKCDSLAFMSMRIPKNNAENKGKLIRNSSKKITNIFATLPVGSPGSPTYTEITCASIIMTASSTAALKIPLGDANVSAFDVPPF
jgi:hypothetical protein